MTLVWRGGPHDGHTLAMPRRLLVDLPPLRLYVFSRSQRHFYESPRYDGQAETLTLAYRGIVGLRRKEVRG